MHSQKMYVELTQWLKNIGLLMGQNIFKNEIDIKKSLRNIVHEYQGMSLFIIINNMNRKHIHH